MILSDHKLNSASRGGEGGGAGEGATSYGPYNFRACEYVGM